MLNFWFEMGLESAVTVTKFIMMPLLRLDVLTMDGLIAGIGNVSSFDHGLGVVILIRVITRLSSLSCSLCRGMCSARGHNGVTFESYGSLLWHLGKAVMPLQCQLCDHVNYQFRYRD